MCTCTSCSADTLRVMADNSGWLEVGGKVMRDLEGEAVGVTHWVGQPEWARGFGMSRHEIVAAVAKAIAGQRLGKRQATLIGAMRDEIADIRGEKATAVCTAAASPAAPGKAPQHFPAPDRQRGACRIYTMPKKKPTAAPRGRPPIVGSKRVIVQIHERHIERLRELGGGGKRALSPGLRKLLLQSFG